MDIIKKFDAPDLPADENPNTGKTPEKTTPEDLSKVDEHEGHKSIKDKIKDALQDWSNDNERDIQEDDSTPLRSGL